MGTQVKTKFKMTVSAFADWLVDNVSSKSSDVDFNTPVAHLKCSSELSRLSSACPSVHRKVLQFPHRF